MAEPPPTSNEAQAVLEALVEAFASQSTVYWAVFSGPDMVITTANDVYVTMTGSRDIVGKPMLDAMPELRGQNFESLIGNVRATGVPHVAKEHRTIVQAHPGAAPEERFYDYTYTRLASRGVVYDSVLVTGHDVTASVRGRREAEARADFEEQLIGIVSHDLRNPLNVISLGSSVLLDHERLDERTLRTAARIRASAAQATRLIHDLLDFTRARLGKGIPVSRSPGDLCAVVQGVVDAAVTEHPTRTIELRHEGTCKASIDRDRIAQAASNLLANALKYSPDGSPVRVVTRIEHAAVALEIHNEGPCIPPEQQAVIFLPLQRAASEVDNSGRSVGLGLYIVKSIVEAHGGSIELVSHPGDGTTFIVRLPRD